MNSDRVKKRVYLLFLLVLCSFIAVNAGFYFLQVQEESNKRYKLAGFGPDWIRANSNTAHYVNISSGEILAVISYDEEKRSGVSFPLKSLSYWETWWFKLIIIFSVVGILYSLYRYHLNMLQKVQHTRQRIALDLHDDISATLSSITFFAQAIHQVQNGQEIERFVNLISESAFEAKEKITDIIWAIDPNKDEWVNLLSKCRRFASDLFESKGMDYEMNIDTDIDQTLDMELRQQLWLIFKEVVINAARHSQAKRVDIFFGLQDGELKLMVQDNGVGIDDSIDRSLGQGIKNINKRAHQLGADLELETDRDIGTRWMMSLEM